jgi:hypothetical protein
MATTSYALATRAWQKKYKPSEAGTLVLPGDKVEIADGEKGTTVRVAPSPAYRFYLITEDAASVLPVANEVDVFNTLVHALDEHLAEYNVCLSRKHGLGKVLCFREYLRDLVSVGAAILDAIPGEKTAKGLAKSLLGPTKLKKLLHDPSSVLHVTDAVLTQGPLRDTYPISFTASINVKYHAFSSIPFMEGGQVTVTGVKLPICPSNAYPGAGACYKFTGITGTLDGEKQDGTYDPCSAPAQEATQYLDYAGGVELGSSPDWNADFGIDAVTGDPDVGDANQCLGEIAVGANGVLTGDYFPTPWSPGSETSSWTAYAADPSALAPVGTITMSWQY